MSQNIIHQRIEDALRAIIPFAQQADEILDGLNQENKGKFKSIFPEKGPFKTQGNRFLPYLEELDQDLKNLPDMQDPVFETLLTDLVKKIESIQIVLNQFHELRDYEDESENPNRPLNS